MKKILLTCLAAAAVSTASADFNGNGYYRVENYKTLRYAEVIDNKATIDWAATNVELHSIRLQKDFDAVCTNPASVLYLNKINSKQYNIEAQGTSIKDIIDYYITVTDDAGSSNGQKLYYAYATYKGVMRFLGDGNSLSFPDLGTLTTNATGDYRKWYIKPITETGDNFFGAAPNISVKGKYYTTLYTSFPYKPTNSKTYYIKRVDHGMAEMVEATGVIPAETAVIIEGTSSKGTDNRMSLGGSGNALSGNSLIGVFFDLDDDYKNFVTYDKKTMRVLGKCEDGSLGFITADIKVIPANTAYIVVPADSPAEFKCVTTAEFDAYTPPEPPAPPTPEALYMVGNFNSWATPSAASTYITLSKVDENTYTGTVNISTPGRLAFKVFDEISDNWSQHAYGTQQTNEITLEADKSYTWNMMLGYGSSDFVVANWGGGTGTVTVNLEANTLKIKTSTVYVEPKYPEELWLAGNFTPTAWDAANKTYSLENKGDGLYTGQFDIPKPAEGESLQFKVVGAADWSLNYGAPGNNNYSFPLYGTIPVSTNIYADGANWAITNWEGGPLQITLDIENNSITILGNNQPDENQDPPGPGPDPEIPEVPAVVYLIGDMNGWDFNSTAYPLNHQDVENKDNLNVPQIYSGDFYIGEGTFYFRFYTELGNAEENSVGSSEDPNVNLDVIFNNDRYSPSVYAGKGCWKLEWGGGQIYFTLNLTSNVMEMYAPNSGVGALENQDSDGLYRVYNLQGVKVMETVDKEAVEALPAGVYIINGRKVGIR